MASITVETSKRKNMRGKILGYTAWIGDVVAEGNTATEAVKNLETLLAEVCKYRTPRVVNLGFGYTCVIAKTVYGMAVTLIYPDGHHGEHSQGWEDYAKIEATQRAHVAQLLYPDVDKAAEVLRNAPAGTQTALLKEFDSWRKFQQAYQAAKAAGLSDVEAHRVAVGIPSVVTASYPKQV